MEKELRLVGITAVGTIVGIFAMRFFFDRRVAAPSPTSPPMKKHHRKNAVLAN